MMTSRENIYKEPEGYKELDDKEPGSTEGTDGGVLSFPNKDTARSKDSSTKVTSDTI